VAELENWPVETAIEEAKRELGWIITRPEPAWLASSYDVDLSGSSSSGTSPVEDGKKSLALTLAQRKMLMQSALGLPELDFKFALEVVLYHQERNYAAYCSHRKRTLKSLKRKSKRPE
jgi:hypothetical protein